ncbi:MAG: cation diffusion facilitator family transporter, partial [Lachnospiraceae bacterium]
MTDWLVSRFIKNSEDVTNARVRTAYGILGSRVGIACNILLFILKFILGALVNSVSVMADAFNNLSDAVSSVISYVGVKMADKPADEKHPFGHGRMEY